MRKFLTTSLKEFFGQRSYFTEKTVKALEVDTPTVETVGFLFH